MKKFFSFQVLVSFILCSGCVSHTKNVSRNTASEVEMGIAAGLTQVVKDTDVTDDVVKTPAEQFYYERSFFVPIGYFSRLDWGNGSKMSIALNGEMRTICNRALMNCEVNYGAGMCKEKQRYFLSGNEKTGEIVGGCLVGRIAGQSK